MSSAAREPTPAKVTARHVMHRSTSNDHEGDGGRADAPAMCEALSTSVQSSLASDPGMIDERTRDMAAGPEWEVVSDGRITIALKRGWCVHADRGFDAETLARVLDVLDRRQPM